MHRTEAFEAGPSPVRDLAPIGDAYRIAARADVRSLGRPVAAAQRRLL